MSLLTSTWSARQQLYKFCVCALLPAEKSSVLLFQTVTCFLFPLYALFIYFLGLQLVQVRSQNFLILSGLGCERGLYWYWVKWAVTIPAWLPTGSFLVFVSCLFQTCSTDVWSWCMICVFLLVYCCRLVDVLYLCLYRSLLSYMLIFFLPHRLNLTFVLAWEWLGSFFE